MGCCTDYDFKVVIVGAGITGLVMSHALSQAGIEHVVLESHDDVVYPAGGSFGIWPNAARILDQLGCWKDIEQRCKPLQKSYIRQPDGQALVVSKIFERVTGYYGYHCLALERQAYVTILYENIADKTIIKTGKRVTNIVQDGEKAKVCLEDGTTEEGDMVVGCDGVHSTVRKIMWEQANREIPGTISASEKRSLGSAYRCLVGVAPPIPGIGESESTTVQHQGFAIQVISQPDRVFFFVCIKRASSICWPNNPRYTSEDAEHEAAKLADLPVTEQVLFGELWMARTRGYLCSLEEGLLDHWHWNRVVLVGDSAHKMSPVLAHGGNCGVESVAALANGLHELLREHSEKPSTEDLKAVFQKYEAFRKPRVRHIYNTVHRVTRIQTSDTQMKRFLTKYLLPLIRDDAMAASAYIKKAVKLNFLKVPTRAEGTVNFDDERSPVLNETKTILKNDWRSYVALATLFFSVFTWMVFPRFPLR